MNVARLDAGSSSFFDSRKYKMCEGKIHFYQSRINKQLMKQHDVSLLEEQIKFPVNLHCAVTYVGTEREFSIPIDDLVKHYPRTMATMFQSRVFDTDSSTKQWISNQIEDIQYTLPIGSIVYLNTTTIDTKRDRVVQIVGIDYSRSRCMRFCQRIIPKYVAHHIDHHDLELNTPNMRFQISNQLQNGKRLYRGGEGLLSDSDITLICDKLDDDDRYRYLKIKLFLSEQKVNMYKDHCKSVGLEAIGCIVNKLISFMHPRNANEPMKAFVDFSEEIRQKEFHLMCCNRNAQPQWIGNKTKRWSMAFDDGVRLFGASVIARNFRPSTGADYRLRDCTHCVYC